MRLVVTQGTGAPVNLPGLPVHAKTGTAEYQDGSQTRTNAWMIGYRGDIAFAAFVANGSSGGHDAGPIVDSLLTALPDESLPLNQPLGVVEPLPAARPEPRGRPISDSVRNRSEEGQAGDTGQLAEVALLGEPELTGQGADDQPEYARVPRGGAHRP